MTVGAVRSLDQRNIKKSLQQSGEKTKNKNFTKRIQSNPSESAVICLCIYISACWKTLVELLIKYGGFQRKIIFNNCNLLLTLNIHRIID